MAELTMAPAAHADEPFEAVEPTLSLSSHPASLRSWLASMWAHREVIGILARKDFQVRYKRASLGILWAVAVPILQAAALVVIFSRVGKFGTSSFNYPMFVLSGTLAWAYFISTLTSATTAIVDGSTFTDKVWFPRAVLVLAPVLGNLVSLGITMIIVFLAIPVLGSPVTLRLLLLFPATALLIAMALAVSLVAAALDVYFRDVKFIVQAGAILWFYITPLVYPLSALGRLGPVLRFNPVTGVASLFQVATAGHAGPVLIPVIVSIGFTLVLLIAGVEAHRRHDRLFVDLL